MIRSPFKFLDPYGPGDRAIFFGRDDEIEELYRLIFQARLVLVYGPSGTGKTSLIECGLASRFQPSDWFPLPVRRQADINAALGREVRTRATTPIAESAGPVEAIRSLALDHLRPICLILDQFEELFISGTEEEQVSFFSTLAELIASDVSCRIVICLREEYLGPLHRFEKVVPTLFNKRLRLEPMSMANVESVILGTTAAFDIQLENGAGTAQKIIDNLEDGRLGVDLAGLQVYLDGLYRRAAENHPAGPVTFTDAAVDETGKVDLLIEAFLDEQANEIQSRLDAGTNAAAPKAVQRVLEQFVTADGTKRSRNLADIVARAPRLAPWVEAILAGLVEGRIVRKQDGLYELSHDSLARSIAARRNVERKNLIQIEKMVRDRIASFELTKTGLDSGELAIVRRSRAELELSEEESAFVDKSVKWARWKTIRSYGCSILLVVASPWIMLFVIIFYFTFIDPA